MLPNAARAVRIEYLSPALDGRLAPVSGAVFVPAGVPPATGWPVLAWAHGTVGIADRCAPSAAGQIPRDVSYLGAWLADGYAIVATDYEGLGLPGPHPYLNGRSEASSVIDSVRAARAWEPGLSRSWAVVGQSQGGQAALFTALRATEYAPELDFRGALATGLPSHWRAFLQLAQSDVFNPSLIYLPLILRSLELVDDGVDARSYVTPEMQGILDIADHDCYEELEAYVLGERLTTSRLLARDTSSLAGLADEYFEVPRHAFDRPIFIGQGKADAVVPWQATAAKVDDLCSAGSRITFRLYPGLDHSGAVNGSRRDSTAWMRTLFDSGDIGPGCTNAESP
jgi:pimeloyl-ACP methyl ester carboxylesterase